MPEPISRSDVADHTAIKSGRGLDVRIFGGRYAIQQSMKKAGKAAALTLRKKAPHLRVGRFYGCGLSGCVYAAPDDPDGVPMVIKMDKGENEATMANLMLKHPDLGRLSSVPRYAEVIPTGVKDEETGMNVYAIHREDLRDFAPEESNLKRFFGSFGMAVHDLSRQAPNRNRAELIRTYDKMVNRYGRQAARSRTVAQHFDRVAEDIRKLIKRGIVPCDVHEENWGIRPHTGEVVMRDVGCSHFSSDIAS
jgi:hypothetical protein